MNTEKKYWLNNLAFSLSVLERNADKRLRTAGYYPYPMHCFISSVLTSKCVYFNHMKDSAAFRIVFKMRGLAMSEFLSS